jgi:SAM-dependent methyltransferase
MPRRHAAARWLPWPLPALLAWASGWAACQAGLAAGAPAAAAWCGGLFAGALVARASAGRWRRTLAAAGFPLSSLALGGLPALPAWAWLLAALPLLLLYPLGAWRDAPFFPTPADALQGLDAVPGLKPPQRVLDAGCGLGHGLAALRALWPQAEFHGIERSRVLRAAAWLRCPWARLRAADMWAAPWGGYDLVYLFQRPESMARALAKAGAEMAPGSWLVSLEFAVPGVPAQACVQAEGRRPVWVYRIGG